MLQRQRNKKQTKTKESQEKLEDDATTDMWKDM